MCFVCLRLVTQQHRSWVGKTLKVPQTSGICMNVAEVFHEKAGKNEVLILTNLSRAEAEVWWSWQSLWKKNVPCIISECLHIRATLAESFIPLLFGQVAIQALQHYPVLQRLEITRSRLEDVESFLETLSKASHEFWIEMCHLLDVNPLKPQSRLQIWSCLRLGSD